MVPSSSQVAAIWIAVEVLGDGNRAAAIDTHLAEPAIGGDVPDPLPIGREEGCHGTLGAGNPLGVALAPPLPQELVDTVNGIGVDNARSVGSHRGLGSQLADAGGEETPAGILPEDDALSGRPARGGAVQEPAGETRGDRG